MPAYYLFDVHEITDEKMMNQYRQAVHATVKQFGGRYLAVGGEVSIVEGNWRPMFPVLIEFPTAKHARDWYSSPEYGAIKDLRIRATRGNAVLLDAAPFNVN